MHLVIATGKGHTESDCILLLPKERIAFTLVALWRFQHKEL